SRPGRPERWNTQRLLCAFVAGIAVGPLTEYGTSATPVSLTIKTSLDGNRREDTDATSHRPARAPGRHSGRGGDGERPAARSDDPERDRGPTDRRGRELRGRDEERGRAGTRRAERRRGRARRPPGSSRRRRRGQRRQGRGPGPNPLRRCEGPRRRGPR